MIRDAREYNESVTPNDFEIERLRAALPEYFDKDGNFMFDRLQESLKEGGGRCQWVVAMSSLNASVGVR